MKKFLLFFFLSFLYLTGFSQTTPVRANIVEALRNLLPPSDTIWAPLKVGEERIVIESSKPIKYICISLVGPRKWIRSTLLADNGLSNEGDTAFVLGGTLKKATTLFNNGFGLSLNESTNSVSGTNGTLDIYKARTLTGSGYTADREAVVTSRLDLTLGSGNSSQTTTSPITTYVQLFPQGNFTFSNAFGYDNTSGVTSWFNFKDKVGADGNVKVTFPSSNNAIVTNFHAYAAWARAGTDTSIGWWSNYRSTLGIAGGSGTGHRIDKFVDYLAGGQDFYNTWSLENRYAFYARPVKTGGVTNGYSFYGEGSLDTLFHAGPTRLSKLANGTSDQILAISSNGTVKTTTVSGTGVDSLWRVLGKDSIFWRKNGITYAIKDSTGGLGGADSIIVINGPTSTKVFSLASISNQNPTNPDSLLIRSIGTDLLPSYVDSGIDSVRFRIGDYVTDRLAALTTTDVTEGTRLYFTEARVRSTVLTGYTLGSNTAISATDNVLSAFGKLQSQINNISVGGGGSDSIIVINGPTSANLFALASIQSANPLNPDSILVRSIGTDLLPSYVDVGTDSVKFNIATYVTDRLAALTTTDIAEGTNQYFTQARVRTTPLTGYVVGANSALAATDDVLGAFGKIQAQLNAKGTGTVTNIATGTFLTGGPITSTGTISLDTSNINLKTYIIEQAYNLGNSDLTNMSTGVRKYNLNNKILRFTTEDVTNTSSGIDFNFGQINAETKYLSHYLDRDGVYSQIANGTNSTVNISYAKADSSYVLINNATKATRISHLPGYYQIHANDSILLTQSVTSSDTTTYKPIGISSTGKIAKMNSWPVGTGGGGSGETNTASNLGGGLANFDSKSGVDLRFNSFNATDFDLASNLISIDATLKSNWNTAYGWGNHAGLYAAASHTHGIVDVTGLQAALDGKQAALVSGTNIKTINGTSILGSGDLTVSGGSPAITSNQIAYGTGSSITSSPNLLFRGDTLLVTGVSRASKFFAQAAGTNASTYVSEVLNSAGTAPLFSVSETGAIRFGGSANNRLENAVLAWNSGNPVYTAGLAVSGTGAMHTFRSANVHVPTTSATVSVVNSSTTGLGFYPSSGSTNYISFLANPLLNQTGTANGTIVGYDYNPTVTSVLGNHYAFRALSGKILVTDLAAPNGQKRMIVSDSTGILDETNIPTESGFASLELMNSLGANIQATTFPMSEVRGTGQGLTDARIQWSAIYVNKSFTATGVRWIQGTQGVYVADAYNGIGLFSYSNGTLTLIASSTDNGELWKATANSGNSTAFSSTVALTPGVYYVAFLYNSSSQTTAPTVGSASSMQSSISGAFFTNSAKLSGTLTGQASFPATQAISGVSSSSSWCWAALY
jgi:hypothetical protein